MSRYISPVLYILLMLVGCMAFVSIAGVRVGIFEPITGFSMLRDSVYASLVLSVLAIVSLVACRKERNVGTQRFFCLVLTVSLVYSFMWIGFYLKRSDLPHINDITTDTQMPPSFINVNFIRSSNENDLAYNLDWAPIQKKYYPNVKPVFTDQSKDQVYFIVADMVSDRGWEVVAKYPAAGMIEATARTPIFGFRDDVAIRILQMEDGEVRIDIRSCSRVGRGDYGVNAERVESFMEDLQVRLERINLPRVNTVR
ncbi:DUF1499 domain-containing protein [Marinomonas sp. THO17]|uniref:DUF1499 domain-containing protein n=1 Tax=Marinomonas sp. THO17 TaxID=3149048 RepID=UPI00336C1DA7